MLDVSAAIGEGPEGLLAGGKLITAVAQGLQVGTVNTDQPQDPRCTELLFSRSTYA